MNHTRRCLIAFALSASCALAETTDWPKAFYLPEGDIVLYQPQPETFKDDRLTARAAVSVTPRGKTEPVFGAVWIDARVSTDRDTRTVTILDVKVPKTRFPNATPDQEARLAKILETNLPKAAATCSLDRLMASLDLAKREQVAAAGLSTAPPRIVFSSTPAVLVTLDGQPQLRPVKDSRVMRVVNTPFVMLFDMDGKAFYLKGGDVWMTAADAMGPWKAAEKVPAAILAAAPAEPAGSQTPSSTPQPSATGMPRVIVATEPTELIVSDGEPVYTPFPGNDLLYVSNTGSDVFMEVATQQYYVLLAGRWYKGASLGGPWTYAPADKLPPSFAKIPPDSPKGRVLASVAGTEQARDAVLDASIPQTAAIKRDAATLTVAYDGKPKFEQIDGTRMSYAVNTSYSVIKLENKYYCCCQAVWYVADSPTGPWEICTEVPKAIYTIPPSNPLYNVTYVNVYDSTPDTVYTGYLPGYTGSYAYGGTMVYGTGYYYPGWYGDLYYPRPWTWGFDPVYYPWTGTWYCGTGYWGRHWVYWGDGHGGWWGPGGYHSWGYLADKYGVKAGDGKITVDGHTYTRGELRNEMDKGRKGIGSGEIGGKKISAGDGKLTVGDKTFDRGELRDNIYSRRDNPARAAGVGKGQTLQARAAGGVENNVFADRNGDVYRLKDNWEQYGKNGWSKGAADRGVSLPGVEHSALEGRGLTQIHGLSRPSSGDVPQRAVSFPASGLNRSEMDYHNYARQYGAERARGFQNDFAARNVPVRSQERRDFGEGRRDFGGRHSSLGGGRPGFGGGGFHGGGFHGGGRR